MGDLLKLIWYAVAKEVVVPTLATQHWAHACYGSSAAVAICCVSWPLHLRLRKYKGAGPDGETRSSVHSADHLDVVAARSTALTRQALELGVECGRVI
jgi:hypothetical protein